MAADASDDEEPGGDEQSRGAEDSAPPRSPPRPASTGRTAPGTSAEVADHRGLRRPRRPPAARPGRDGAAPGDRRGDRPRDVRDRPARGVRGPAAGLRRAAHARASGTRSAPRSPPASPARAAPPTRCPGPSGASCIARIPVRTPDGRTGHQPARFAGVDGPRWFLRAVFHGAAVHEPEARRARRVASSATSVVVRGAEAMAPRELLPLRLPEHAGRGRAARRPRRAAAGVAGPVRARSGDHRDPLTRHDARRRSHPATLTHPELTYPERYPDGHGSEQRSRLRQALSRLVAPQHEVHAEQEQERAVRAGRHADRRRSRCGGRRRSAAPCGR